MGGIVHGFAFWPGKIARIEHDNVAGIRRVAVHATQQPSVVFRCRPASRHENRLAVLIPRWHRIPYKRTAFPVVPHDCAQLDGGGCPAA
jgi:hypothetical protein